MTGDAFGVVGPRSMAHIQAQIRRLQDLGGYLPQRGHLQNVFREQLKGVEAAMSQMGLQQQRTIHCQQVQLHGMASTIGAFDRKTTELQAKLAAADQQLAKSRTEHKLLQGSYEAQLKMLTAKVEEQQVALITERIFGAVIKNHCALMENVAQYGAWYATRLEDCAWTLQDELQEASEKLESCEAHLADSSQQMTHLHECNQQLDDKLVKQQQAAEAVKLEVDAYKARLGDSNSKLAELMRANHQLQGKLAKQHAASEATAKHASEGQALLAGVQRTNACLARQLEAAQLQVCDLQAANDKLQKTPTAFKAQASRLLAALHKGSSSSSNSTSGSTPSMPGLSGSAGCFNTLACSFGSSSSSKMSSTFCLTAEAMEAGQLQVCDLQAANNKLQEQPALQTQAARLLCALRRGPRSSSSSVVEPGTPTFGGGEGCFSSLAGSGAISPRSSSHGSSSDGSGWGSGRGSQLC